MPVHPHLAAVQQERPGRALRSRPIYRTADSGRQWNQYNLAALAAHT